jgi:hypothetical protein
MSAGKFKGAIQGAESDKVAGGGALIKKGTGERAGMRRWG